MRYKRGFTLIEVMIVLAVIAILAAIAVPSYQESVRKSRRADAKLALTTCSQALERYLTQNGTYAGAQIAATGIGAGAVVCALNSEHNAYQLGFGTPGATVTTNPATNTSLYALVATPQASQQNDSCGSFTLDQSGTKGVSSSTVAECW